MPQFLAGFKGLTDRRLRSLVARWPPLVSAAGRAVDRGGTSLDPERTAALLAAMQDAGRAPKAGVLGGAGEPAVEPGSRTWPGTSA